MLKEQWNKPKVKELNVLMTEWDFDEWFAAYHDWAANFKPGIPTLEQEREWRRTNKFLGDS